MPVTAERRISWGIRRVPLDLNRYYRFQAAENLELGSEASNARKAGCMRPVGLCLLLQSLGPLRDHCATPASVTADSARCSALQLGHKYSEPEPIDLRLTFAYSYRHRAI